MKPPDLVGLIPAAGRGVRAYPYTDTIPKSMLEVDGVPVLQRNLELMRDQLGIRDLRIVIGHQGHVIERHFGDGSAFGVRITYVHNPRLDLDLPYSVLLAGRDIRTPCCMILADECYIDSNHAALRSEADPTALVTCGVINAESAKQIRKNYSVTLRDGAIVDLQEKPAVVSGRLMGTGTYLLHPEVFTRLQAAFGSDHGRGPRDWTSWLASLARGGARLRPFFLTGRYVNINSRDDLNYANYLVRERHFDEKRTSLVYVVEDHEDAAAAAVEGFAALDEIDEVVVVRRSAPGASDAGAVSKVRVVTAAADTPLGARVKLGLDRATGSVLLLGYSDDTFTPRDLSKFLVYLRDADMVVGTRTTRQMIEQGANMRGVVRAAHVVLAKLLQLLWWRFESRFTDICCVYRGLWRSTYQAIRGNLSSPGVEIFPELTIEVLRARRRIIEIPIHYYNRDLERSHVTTKYQSVTTFRRVVSLLLRKRWSDTWLGRRRARAQRPEADRLDQASREAAEAEHFKRLERRWQDEVGVALLDKPYEAPGSAAVFHKQWDQLIRRIDPARRGPVVEIGCGKGHFLRRVRDTLGDGERTLIGIDISRAVLQLPAHGLAGARADGEFLPFRDGSAAHVLFDGALHHVINYPAALREAMRILSPGGRLIIYEPSTSRFNNLVHRLLDPLVFRKAAVYESPIDIHYKTAFRQDVIVEVLHGSGMRVEESRSDFLAYPFTGCYAGSAFARSERFMRLLLAIEERVATLPVVRRAAAAFAWRFTIVATKDAD
jgi:NDP-sugar pyrophosphorylase family protein/SAM-dependent methyltransferase